jgi:hypothetical protein
MKTEITRSTEPREISTYANRTELYGVQLESIFAHERFREILFETITAVMKEIGEYD